MPSDVRPELIRANLLGFGRRLRAVGLPVGPGQVMALVDALGVVEPRRRDDVYHAARATLVTRPEQIPTFDAEFARFWRGLAEPNPEPLAAFAPTEAPDQLPMPTLNRRQRQNDATPPMVEQERTIVAVTEGEPDDGLDDTEEVEAPPEDVLIFSAREVLRKKDFSECSPEEIAEARRVIEAMDWQLGTRRTRRRVKANRGDQIDPRATLRRSLRSGGVPIDLRRRRRKVRTRPLVLLCDISGSMDRYARLLLRFVHALGRGIDDTEVFVFGTRLTRITRELRKRDVDQALADAVKSVDDWSGGTRIGEAIKVFNYRWSRRVLRSGATVVIISDGWDRGDPVLLSREIARLQRSCRRLIWLNPLLGSPGYQPLTQGIRAALPYVDEFLPVHNLQSLEALARMLGTVADEPPLRRTQRAPSPAPT